MVNVSGRLRTCIGSEERKTNGRTILSRQTDTVGRKVGRGQQSHDAEGHADEDDVQDDEGHEPRRSLGPLPGVLDEQRERSVDEQCTYLISQMKVRQ